MAQKPVLRGEVGCACVAREVILAAPLLADSYLAVVSIWPTFVPGSFWFTCDKRREMKSFLDGKMHVRFGGHAGSIQDGGEL